MPDNRTLAPPPGSQSPDNYIAGGGFFTRFLQLVGESVWDTFGEANGVRSLDEDAGSGSPTIEAAPLRPMRIPLPAASCWPNRFAAPRHKRFLIGKEVINSRDARTSRHAETD